MLMMNHKKRIDQTVLDLTQFMLFDEVSQHQIEIRSSDFLPVLVNSGFGLFDFDNAVQIDGGGDDLGITFGVIDGRLHVF